MASWNQKMPQIECSLSGNLYPWQI